ncbi:hypothetical protein AAMO2058_001213400 [Amorphochlora amoebiformis]
MSNLTRFRGQGGMVDLGLVWVLWWCHLMVDIWLLGTKMLNRVVNLVRNSFVYCRARRRLVKLPTSIGFAIESSLAENSEKILELLQACASYGLTNITLYDAQGKMRSHGKKIAQSLAGTKKGSAVVTVGSEIWVANKGEITKRQLISTNDKGMCKYKVKSSKDS